ncbi:MAG: sigma-70 family RNA polymerase sigma factor [Actinomycetota bacterium]|nr:sigma-70 family RNA polymerase sigma factor [Actinomycetota bacterium]
MSESQHADEELVRELYDQYARGLLGYVSGLMGADRQRAEDIVQETLMRAWRHPEVLQDEGRSPRGWLFTVARNLVIDAHRAQLARPPEVLVDPPDRAGSTDGGMDALLTRFELLNALDCLNPVHRDVLLLVFYEDRSIAQAAQALGVPEGTVKSRCHYALRALRVLFQERGLIS